VRVDPAGDVLSPVLPQLLARRSPPAGPWRSHIEVRSVGRDESAVPAGYTGVGEDFAVLLVVFC